MSDGSATLRFLDPGTLGEVGRIEVRDKHGPVERLNELEFVQGEIYANVWKTDRIAIIASQTGKITGWIDLKGLLDTEPHTRRTGELNGIAYDPENDRLFLTGKLWPRVFEVRLLPPKN
jgi:glutamine cyclotransferase